MDTIARGLALQASKRRRARTVTLPTAISTAWTLSQWKPASVTLYDSAVDPYVDMGITASALFDLFSTARSAPSNTYYVNFSTGNDTTGTGASGAPWLSIHKAVTAANTSGLPATVIVTAGSYPRLSNPSNGNAVLPTVDIAFIATGGRVITGTWDDFTALSVDATNTNTYSVTIANIDRVVDRLVIDRFGNYAEMLQVGTAAICNRTPGSWAYVSGVLYINRADGAAVTNTNTRYYRAGSGTVKIVTPVSVFFGGLTAGDGFDMEGGNGGGCINYSPTTVPGSNKALICDGCSFKYAGGQVDTAATGVAIKSINGLAAFFNCRADANQTDGFNFHNDSAPAAKVHALCVNCTGFNNGRAVQGATSCNGFTLHEDIVGIDYAGIYRNHHGGTIRNINTSKAFLAGTVAHEDYGDRPYGGAVPPTAVRADDTAVIYCDGVIIDMPGATYGLYASTGAAILHRNVAPMRVTSGGGGTVSTY